MSPTPQLRLGALLGTGRALLFIFGLLGASGDLVAQIKFSGTFAYSAVGNTVTFGVTRIDNFRPIGTISGTLAIQLWTTTLPYSGISTLVGNKVAEVQLGTLLGGYYISPITRTTVLSNLPAPGYYNIVFVLAEWNGFQWLTVDYGNFPSYQPIGVVVSPPTISTQPQPLSLTVGGSGTLSVAGTGTQPLSFQWFKNGVAISGKTDVTLVFANAQAGDAGSYTVRVTNSAGTVTSEPAAVTVSQAATAPAITTQPQPLALSVGGSGTISVVSSGSAPLSFQWFRNGNALSGKTDTSLSFSNAQIADSGAYTVRVTNSAGSVLSGTATISVAEHTQPPVIVTQPADQTVTEGASVTLTVIASSGTSLQYAWTRNGSVVAGATSSTLKLNSVSRSDEGVYAVRVTNSAGSVTSNQAAVSVLPASALSNLSVRTTLASGQTLTLGAVISGGSKDILIRAAGPVLGKFGLNGMTDPKLDLFRGGASPAASNDDWNSSLSSTFTAVGAFAFDAGSKDAAIRESLNGAFTVQAKGTGPGAILVETYDVTGGTGRRLVNVSARNHVGTGDEILIAGFAISGTGIKRVLIRAIGPTLGAFGVDGALADPLVRVFDSRNTIVGSNENWENSLSATFSQVGAFPLAAGSKDAAIVLSLPAGASYTVQVSGADGGTGEALVEIYEVP